MNLEYDHMIADGLVDSPKNGDFFRLDNHCCPYKWPSHCKDSHGTHSTLKVAANLTQILNFKANSHKAIELFKKKIMLTIIMVDTLTLYDPGGGFKSPPSNFLLSRI